MALSEARITIELREVFLNDRPKELYQISKKGTVPVLKINNLVIDESIDIMHWAIEQSNLKWLDENREKQLNYINTNDTDFKYWLDRYKYHDRYPDNKKKYYREKAMGILDKYDNHLEHAKFLAGNNIGVSDVAIFPFIRQFCNVDPNWFMEHYNFLSSWLTDFIESELFLSIMGKYNKWENSSERLILKF